MLYFFVLMHHKTTNVKIYLFFNYTIVHNYNYAKAINNSICADCSHDSMFDLSTIM